MPEIPKGYKQTEVGIIPEEWEVKQLGNVCKRITTGKLDANQMVPDGDFPFFTCARENYWIDKYAFDCEALLVSGNGANVGYVHYYNGKFNAYQRTYVITEFTVDVQFVKAFLVRNILNCIRVEVNAGNTPYITMDTLTKMAISIPPFLPAQRTISGALSDADALIESLERLIAKKRQIKQGAMQELLTGKRRLPGFSGAWEMKRLGDIIENAIGGGTPSRNTPAYWGDDIPWATVKDFATFDPWLTQESITKEGLVKSASHLIPAGTLITATRMALGKAMIYEVDVAINQDLKALVLKSGIAVRFLSYWFEHFGHLLNSIGGGSTVKGISLTQLRGISLQLPPLKDEQSAIAEVLSDMDAEIEALDSRLAKARLVKQGMMQELLTGRIRLV